MTTAPSAARVLWNDDTLLDPGAGAGDLPATCDVAIVGGGFTGLSTALSLARRGVRTLLLEAGDLAAQASGRNGGQVVPGLKPHPDHLVQRVGMPAAARMMRFANSAADYTFGLIEQFAIDCAPTRNGWIQCAITTAARHRLHARVRALTRWGAPVEALSAADMAQATGSRYYTGGYIELGAGAVHPRKFALGLAAAARAAGATLHGGAPVRALAPDDQGWILQVPQGRIQARGVVLATDAYTGKLYTPLSRSMLSVSSAQAATEPLPPHLLGQILPRGAGVSEARKLTVYCRISPDGRFLIGGRGTTGDRADAGAVQRLRAAAEQRFPMLAEVRWDAVWAGRVTLTLDDVPHLHNPAPGLWTASGYGGRGVALAVRFGPTLADAVTGTASAHLDYPVTPLRPLPWHAVRGPAVRTAIHWHRLRDAVGLPA